MIDLVPFSHDHFSLMSEWFQSEREVVQWGGPALSYPLDDRQLDAMLEEALRKPPSRLCWMAHHDEGLIGHAQLALDWRNGNATLGRVAIAPAARGKRYASPMVSKVIAEAFARPEIERVELHVFPSNEAAIRTYGRLGFKHEGVRRSSARVGLERWDTAIMALLRGEFPIRTK